MGSFIFPTRKITTNNHRRVATMKSMFSKLTFVLVGLVLSWCASADDLAGKTMYVQTNMWYENPQKIVATNYHVGTLLAPGTKVTIDEVEDESIRFKDASGTQYRIVIVVKHNNVLGPALVQRLFGADDPMATDGRFQKFTKEEQDNIRAGYIVKGMSKEAVLMAYGYPPTIRTASTDLNIWTYWKNRWVTRIIRFDDKNRVADIQG